MSEYLLVRRVSAVSWGIMKAHRFNSAYGGSALRDMLAILCTGFYSSPPMRLAFLILTIFVTQVAGQRLTPGFIVNNNGDTVRGFVSKQSLDNGYNVCRFTTDAELKPIDHGPADIRSFGGEGVLYRSMDGNSLNVRDRVFVRILVEGRSLTVLEAAGSQFAMKPDTADQPSLINFKFRGLLSYFASNCSDLKDDVLKVRQNRGSVVHFTEALYKCYGEPYTVYVVPLKKQPPNFYVNAGYGLSTLSFKVVDVVDEHDFTNVSFSPSMAPQFGFGFEQYLSSSRQPRWGYSINALATKYLFQGTSSVQHVSYFEYQNVMYEYFALSVPVFVKYDFVRFPKAVFSVSAGLSAQWNFLKKATWIRDLSMDNEIILDQGDLPMYATRAVAIAASIGWRTTFAMHPMHVDMRYHIQNTNEFKSHSISVIAGMAFNKLKKP